jgi:hypothetical protein
VHSDVGRTEFLILVRQVHELGHIADACDTTLGLALYKGGGNLNTKTLDDLGAGSCSSRRRTRELNAPRAGILSFRTCRPAGKPTRTTMTGCNTTAKVALTVQSVHKDQAERQKQTADPERDGALGNPAVVGMILDHHGLIESIRKRRRHVDRRT